MPIHFRHMVIEKHCVKVTPRGKSQSFSRGLCGNNDVSRSFKQRSLVFQDHVIIIDTEKHFARPLIRPTHKNLQKGKATRPAWGRALWGIKEGRAALPLPGTQPKVIGFAIPHSLAIEVNRVPEPCLFKIAHMGGVSHLTLSGGRSTHFSRGGEKLMGPPALFGLVGFSLETAKVLCHNNIQQSRHGFPELL